MSAQIFELKYPFEFKSKEYTSFTARRPKVRDLRKFLKDIDKDSVNAMEKILGDLTETDPIIIGELDLEDFNPMKKWFEDFLKPMMDGSPES